MYVCMYAALLAHRYVAYVQLCLYVQIGGAGECNRLHAKGAGKQMGFQFLFESAVFSDHFQFGG